MAGCLVGWLVVFVGLLVGWSVGCLVGWLVFVGLLVGCSVGWLLGCWLVIFVGWLVGCLVGWLPGWVVGRLVGCCLWLAGCFHWLVGYRWLAVIDCLIGSLVSLVVFVGCWLVGPPMQGQLGPCLYNVH